MGKKCQQNDSISNTQCVQFFSIAVCTNATLYWLIVFSELKQKSSGDFIFACVSKLQRRSPLTDNL